MPREADVPACIERAVSLAFANATVHLDSVRRLPAGENEETHSLEELHFSEGTFENLVYGSRDSEADRFRRLNSELAGRVEVLGRVFDLSHSQKRKLILAGKSDIEKVRARVTELRERFEEPLFVESVDLLALHAWAFDFVIEARTLRGSLHDDPFLEGSMLAKVLLHQLTPGQIAEYEQRPLKLRTVPIGIERKKRRKSEPR